MSDQLAYQTGLRIMLNNITRMMVVNIAFFGTRNDSEDDRRIARELTKINDDATSIEDLLERLIYICSKVIEMVRRADGRNSH